MTHDTDSNPPVHICTPPTVWLRTVALCPTCDRRRRFSGFWSDYYGTTWTCCGCGDSWADGQRLPRPFARGWRAREIADARKRWFDAPARSVAMVRIQEILEPKR